LRFAQTSGALDDISRTGHYSQSPRSFAFSDSDTSQKEAHVRLGNLVPPKLVNRYQGSVYKTHAPSTDCLSTSSSQLHLTRSEQVALARSLRESVILDAADEAIYKIGRRSSRLLSPRGHTPAPPSSRPSMESQAHRAVDGKACDRDGLDTFYDSFRWLDGEDDLDLSLQLDDYHANLKESLPRPSKEHRPSFRRHLSINKIPFGRPSISASRPGTNGGMPSPTSPTPNSATTLPHGRRKSRALSFINMRHVAQESASSIDPNAAHYQDPEARAKLRVYLASPQKFDEAVEFGFPSKDAVTALPAPGSQTPRGHSRQLLSQDSSRFQTFFSDDRSSVYSDDLSIPDPESPRTPQSPDKADLQAENFAGVEGAHIRKVSDSYAQIPATSREMTLRMTLTRPDLRACEDDIYGWQKGSGQQTNKAAQFAPHQEDMPPRKTHMGDSGNPKQSLEAFFASLDQEEEAAAENGVVKRFWNKVRRN
jgi:hypothetical protein